MFIQPNGIVTNLRLTLVTNGEHLTLADVAPAKAARAPKSPYWKLMMNGYWTILSRDCRHNMEDASILYDRSLIGEKDADVVVHRLHAAAAKTGGIPWLAIEEECSHRDEVGKMEADCRRPRALLGSLEIARY